MLIIRNIIPNVDGTVIAEISVADKSELVTQSGDTVFSDGSSAWAIEEGKIYGLSNGSWHEQGGGRG